MADERPSSFRARFVAGERLVGSFIKTPSVHATEIFGLLGYDFVVVDEEHAAINRETTDLILLAARSYGLAGLVRVASADPTKILSALDCGATGVLVPHVATPARARDVAAAGRYRGGRRGYSGSARAGAYTGTPMWDLVAAQDNTACIIAMIEDPDALDDIDAIVETDGLHGFFIGRGDLTVALGASSSKAPAVTDAVAKVVAAAQRVRKPVCVMVGAAAEVPDFARLGATSFIVASDQMFMRRAAAAALAELKEP